METSDPMSSPTGAHLLNETTSRPPRQRTTRPDVRVMTERNGREGSKTHGSAVVHRDEGRGGEDEEGEDEGSEGDDGEGVSDGVSEGSEVGEDGAWLTGGSEGASEVGGEELVGVTDGLGAGCS